MFFPGTFGEKNIFSIQYSQLYELWAKSAEGYKRNIFGKIYYLVPEVYTNYDLELIVGFVASEGTPFYYATNSPLDFISMCHMKHSMVCKPTAYSIPLGLKFNFLGGLEGEHYHWNIEEIGTDDLNDALDDEALDAPMPRK